MRIKNNIFFICIMFCMYTFYIACKSQKDLDNLEIVIIRGENFKAILLENNTDTINGFYTIRKDSFFLYSCYRNPCDKLDLKHKEHFPNNYFFPPEKYKDNLLKYKHVARDEVTVEPFIREFIINEDFEIIDFKTLNKNDKFYFYYD